MKRNVILLGVLGVFALAFALSAAAQALQQDGAAIKGTAKGQRGESPVEGKVDGNKIHFTIHRQTPNGERLLEYNGTVDGDSMKGTAKFGDNDREWTATRSKAASQ
jgi:hypothetical protein